MGRIPHYQWETSHSDSEHPMWDTPHIMKQETLPERLKRLVEERGTNPRALSLAAGLNQTAVRDIVEGNSKRPLHTTIAALATHLDVDPDYLACRTNDPRGAEKPAPEHERLPNEYEDAIDRKFDEIRLRLTPEQKMAAAALLEKVFPLKE